MAASRVLAVPEYFDQTHCPPTNESVPTTQTLISIPPPHTQEAAGEVVEGTDGRSYKAFYGMSSATAMHKYAHIYVCVYVYTCIRALRPPCTSTCIYTCVCMYMYVHCNRHHNTHTPHQHIYMHMHIKRALLF